MPKTEVSPHHAYRAACVHDVLSGISAGVTDLTLWDTNEDGITRAMQRIALLDTSDASAIELVLNEELGTEFGANWEGPAENIAIALSEECDACKGAGWLYGDSRGDVLSEPPKEDCASCGGLGYGTVAQ